MQYANGYLFARRYPRMYSPRMSIGDRLDKAMKEAKFLSQSALGRASGVPQATISRILKGGGKKGPETATITALAAACNVTFDWLNEGIGSPGRSSKTAGAKREPPPRPEAANDKDVTGDEILELITAYKMASAAERSIILASAKTAAKRAAGKKGRLRGHKP